MPTPIVPVKTGDIVRLKKPHPCGTNSWEVVRVGMDIGLKCRGCDRKVMLVRSEFDRRFRGFIERSSERGSSMPERAEGASADSSSADNTSADSASAEDDSAEDAPTSP